MVCPPCFAGPCYSTERSIKGAISKLLSFRGAEDLLGCTSAVARDPLWYLPFLQNIDIKVPLIVPKNIGAMAMRARGDFKSGRRVEMLKGAHRSRLGRWALRRTLKPEASVPSRERIRFRTTFCDLTARSRSPWPLI